ncbi:hypothetical protein B0S90_2816 [Caldicellulosiruptor bescii]|uniref:Uncharacterized protein n=2 Tax=Caldicellulosiruptor bescii TaxID=31899 RepID=B9MNL0_CALBD|nr:hypothetical protein [Caldicellulosiruptor bescii]ACM61541.1 hypothetical protein Athe_2473 [Caldicellulosiruptor bescii DSM 6725]PBC88647.1 hypothetical protein B0S87_1675 [Caldicellulosiruptor bescii]PBC91872.1 hypothetical protein B0S89_2318 [Caldicellulosiruptor bescii]PBD02717.1 hypothetical protein B0S85_0256 [Caldicellulosiruptor bescii]PBD07666.1 hypothetical protein B0S90_2816 [Caldicellulosiruptor bescii]
MVVDDGVYEHHADLEENGQWQKLQEEIQQIMKTLKQLVPPHQHSLLDELMDKIFYMNSMAELNAYKFGLFDGAKLLNLLTTGEILRCADP